MLDSRSQYHILLVSHIPEELRVLRTMLYREEITVSIAQNGTDAMTLVMQKPPDLVLLSVTMPDMDGFEVCRRVKASPKTREIPVIFLTGKTRSDDIVKGLELGAVDYITKPFHQAELLARVLTHLELKHTRDLLSVQNRQLAEKNEELHTFYAHKEQHFFEAIREIEQQYRLLAQQVADGIGIIQDGKLVFVNNALTKMLGLTVDQLVGTPLLDFAADDNRSDMQQAYQQIEAGDDDPQWQVLQWVMKGDGQEIWIEGRHSLIEWQEKPAILVSMRDISQHKLRELEIEQEKEFLLHENLRLKSTLKERYRFGEIIGKSAAMQEVYELILDAAASDANVIIYGESGTGKELIAQTIHQSSGRYETPFVPVNCGAIQETLFESEFFGHRKGAFTGAHCNKAGLFELARGGSLFLDELEALTPSMQTKLLRAIDGGGYLPVGGKTLRKTDVRLIAATNKNLFEQIEQGLMRQDFLYRIHVIALTVPPLRERREDIPLLIDHFLKKYRQEAQQPVLSGSMLNTLYDYDWPGNVRELQNTIQRFLATKRLNFIGSRKQMPQDDVTSDQERRRLPEALNAFEKRMILRTLQQQKWNKTRTAAMLGITRRSLIRRLKKYGLKSPAPDRIARS